MKEKGKGLETLELRDKETNRDSAKEKKKKRYMSTSISHVLARQQQVIINLREDPSFCYYGNGAI